MPDHPEMTHTYDDWLRCGRHVIRGEKSTQRDAEGRAVFFEHQTAPFRWAVYDENDIPDIRSCYVDAYNIY